MADSSPRSVCRTPPTGTCRPISCEPSLTSTDQILVAPSFRHSRLRPAAPAGRYRGTFPLRKLELVWPSTPATPPGGCVSEPSGARKGAVRGRSVARLPSCRRLRRGRRDPARPTPGRLAGRLHTGRSTRCRCAGRRVQAPKVCRTRARPQRIAQRSPRTWPAPAKRSRRLHRARGVHCRNEPRLPSRTWSTGRRRGHGPGGHFRCVRG